MSKKYVDLHSEQVFTWADTVSKMHLVCWLDFDGKQNRGLKQSVTYRHREQSEHDRLNKQAILKVGDGPKLGASGLWSCTRRVS